MIFSSFHDFLYMQGHGPYVWSAYFVSMFLLVSITLLPVIKKSRLEKNIRRRAYFEKGSAE